MLCSNYFSIVISLLAIKNVNKNNDNLPINYTSAIWMYDTATPEKAMGISDYSFVARVNKILRTEYKNPVEVKITADGKKNKIVYDPYTIYEITIIDNIKGEIITTEPIELMQFGGLNKDGKSYTFLNDSGLLTLGNYYIFLANVWPEENILEVSEPTRIINLGNRIDSSDSINNIDIYKKAYINQVIPADFKSQNLISKYDIHYVK